MRFLFFGFLALIAAGLLAALIMGFAFKLVGLGILAVIVVAVASFLIDRIHQPHPPRGTLDLDRPVPRNTMRFDHDGRRLRH